MDPLETPGAIAEGENAAGKMATDKLCQDSQKSVQIQSFLLMYRAIFFDLGHIMVLSR